MTIGLNSRLLSYILHGVWKTTTLEKELDQKTICQNQTGASNNSLITDVQAIYEKLDSAIEAHASQFEHEGTTAKT